MARIVIALGGNALGNNAAEQQKHVRAVCPALVSLAGAGHSLVVTHGNGPQVGMLHLAFEEAARVNSRVPPMPLAECTAMSQGYIGYHLQKALRQALYEAKLAPNVVSLVTQVAVEPDDPAFRNPTKPIGAFYDEAAAGEMMRKSPSLVMREDAGRGWRRLVPSPEPASIAESDAVNALLAQGFLVIACGGGGVPVMRELDGRIHGAEAVIDKDFASAALAEAVRADTLVILTAVEHVCLHFGTPEERPLRSLHAGEAEAYLARGEFGAGSMAPKVAAAVRFVRGGQGRRAVIASLAGAAEAVTGEGGTQVLPDNA